MQYYRILMILKRFLTSAFIFWFFAACEHNPLDINPEEIEVNHTYSNLDSILVNTAPEKLVFTLENEKFIPNDVLDYTLGYCIGVGKIKDSGTVDRIQLFLKEPYIARLEKRISEKFGSLSIQKQKINLGFQYLGYHFPTKKMPERIVFINSFFASSVFATETEIAVGLDRYLGPKTDVIQELPEDQIFQWVKAGMEPKYVERDVLTAWIMTHLVDETNENVASEMIRWGKIIYLTQAAFPNEELAWIMRYSSEDFKWATDNEAAFWKYVVDEKLLFSNKERDKNNFLNEAPFTVGLPEKGPDRLGQFLGWKMVQSYMKKNSKKPLQELIDVPYNEILQSYE